MMDKLMDDVAKLVGEEKARAYEQYGRINSIHEGFGVLAEEVQELEESSGGVVKTDVMKRLISIIRIGNDAELQNALGKILTSAIESAAEAVQVAAVCCRVLDMMKEREHNE